MRQVIEGVRKDMHRVAEAQGPPKLTEEEALVRYMMYFQNDPQALLRYAGGNPRKARQYEAWANKRLGGR